MSERKLLLATTLMVGMMIGAAFPAAAQDEAVNVEELVVTGTHLPHTTFSTPSPVDVIDPDDGRLEGLFDGAALLQTSPIGAGSLQQTGLITGLIQNGGPGVSTLSLRGLGDQRTLVLMNGRRLPPAGVQGQVGAVDLNILPSAAIERYEVLKDGASSVYGSDAVAGVVNIITRRGLDGAVLTADGTIGEDGGGEEYRLSGAFGRVFDTGDFQISAEWYRREALTLGDRQWLDCGESYTFDPATGARNDLIDPATGKPKCLSTKASTGYINVYDLSPAFYGRRTPGAGADPYTPGYRDISLAEINFDPQAEDGATVLPAVDRYTVFAEGRLRRGGYEGYGEFLFSRRESEEMRLQSIGQPVSPLAPCSANPFGFFCPGGAGLIPLTPFLATREEAQRVDVTRTVVGVRGDVASLEGWSWDAHLSYSRSHGEYERTGIYADRMYFVTGVDGGLALAPICPPEAPAGCSPLNFFTPEIIATGLLPQSYLDYLAFREMGETDYDQLIGEAVLTGDLFQAPAGPVAAAFGVSFRKDWLDDSPGPQAVAGNYWGSATAGPTTGDDSVYEAFAEVGVPVTAALDLNLSGRYSNYDSYGANGTYKAGLNWRVIDTLRVRATYGTSFRAPALYEMFLNDQTAFLSQSSVDPCIRWNESGNPALRANCSNPAQPLGNLPADFGGLGTSAGILIGGGSELEPEESTSRSLGVVWAPKVWDLQVAVDYWDVEIENEVTSLASAVVGQCYSSADFPNNPFCDLFSRRADGDREITFVDASFRNVVSQTTRGVDLTARAAHDLGPGRAAAELQATWTLEDKRELFAGRVDDINGVIGEPDFVASASVRYDMGPWTATWSVDFIGRQSNNDYQFGTNCAPAGVNPFAGPAGYAAYCAVNSVEAVVYNHASLSYETQGWTLTGGVRNLFDETPPFVSDALEPDRGEATYTRLGNTPGTSQYDMVGRRVFLGLSKKF